MSVQQSCKRSQLSIHSFFNPENQIKKHTTSETISKPGDGFTEAELMKALDPLSRDWDPGRKYKNMAIFQLTPGPRPVSFMGRIVNFNTRKGRSTEQPKAKGWHYITLSDGTSVILIKLYFAVTPYPLRLGQLLTLWTAFISEKTLNDKEPIDTISVSANMFPGRVATDHVLIHHSNTIAGICQMPLGHIDDQELSQLITLDSYLKSGYDDVVDIKLLVIITSISPIQKIRRPGSSEEYAIVNVGIKDNTAQSRITLWNEIISSTSMWHPNETVLLISNPGYKSSHSNLFQGKGSLRILRNTMIEIDPNIRDANWLRKWAGNKAQCEAVTWKSENCEWDFEAAEYGAVRVFFTLAELDKWIRSDATQTITGFINVVIRSVELHRLYRRGMLMCAQCCGILIYSNTSTATCATCGNLTYLLPNVSILGQLLDETGCIDGSSLIWTPRAWEKLFGRPAEAISAWSADECEFFEQRLCFLRVHLCIGWKEVASNISQKVGVGKLHVLGVHM